MRRLVGAAVLFCAATFSVEAGYLDQLKDKLGRVGFPEVNLPRIDPTSSIEASGRVLNEFAAQIAAIKPQLEALNFAASTFRVQLLPPAGKLRLVTDARSLIAKEANLIDGSLDDAPPLAKAILSTAIAANETKRLMDFAVAVIDVEISGSPTIQISFMSEPPVEGSMPLQDIELLCNQAL